MSCGAVETDQWRALAAQKEKEWRDFTEQRYS